ncbi:helix-turn-helix transcriptional regulator [Streptosporangium sp. NPDC000563]|uniref:helix-turn-helix domain-containing protein n=1 Tax=Streptosporangium sp. NPDC000563 TaxID=3154366 RepID=UPI003322A543
MTARETDLESDKTLVGRKLVGARLREMRLAQNLTQGEAAKAIRATGSKISRMEEGLRGLRPNDLSDLLTLYGVTDRHQQAMLISVATGERNADWWDQRSLPLEEAVRWHREGTATLIRSYNPTAVPDLLQTPECAAALFRTSRHPQPSQDLVDHAVKYLQQRQHALDTDDGPRFWAVIEEPALWRPIGGITAHLKQLDALIERIQNPRIRIWVNPMDTTFMPRCAPFSIFRFPIESQKTVIHDLGAEHVSDWRGDEERVMTFDRLVIAARAHTATAGILTKIRNRIHAESLLEGSS